MIDLTVKDIRPFVGCKNYNLSRDFYLALGWVVKYESKHIRLLGLGDHSFYLQNYYQKKWCDNTMLHISVVSVDDWFVHVQDIFTKYNFSKPARHSHDIKDEGYGRVFHVWDPVGTLLHIAQFHE